MQNASGYTLPSTAQALSFDPSYNRHTSKPPISRRMTTPASMTAPSLQSMPTPGQRLSTLPSTSNLSAAPAFDYTATNLAHGQGWSDVGTCTIPSDHRRDRAPDVIPSLPSDEELCHLSRFFIMNLLPQIPILTELDVADLNATIKSKRPLAYSMAFAAARFVPGCKAIRTMLTPTIVSLAKLQFDRIGHVESTDEDRWTLLQALAILYNWAPQQHTDPGASDDDFPTELWQEMLRASIETLALRHSLHKSAEEVVDLLKQGVENVQRTFAFRKYLYWLWLFSVAHFRSLVSQTPPSIREDATITHAVQLLESMAADDCVRCILARVELCLLWVPVGLRERGLGEWWCYVHAQVNLDSTLTLLDDLDVATQRWRQKWCPPEKHASFDDVTKSGREGAIDFCYHFTCFCIGTYVARAFQSSTSVESLTVSRTNLLMKTIERAHNFCQFFLELSPLAKSSVCFGPEIIFAMVEAGCEYLLHTHSSSVEPALVQPGHLSTVRGVAELMVDLGVDERHGARICGQRILAKMDTTMPTEGLHKPQRPKSHHKRSLTWAAGGNEQQAASKLLPFATTTDDTLRVQESVGQRELSNGHHQGLSTSSSDVIGLWAPYHGGEALGSGDLYWTS